LIGQNLDYEALRAGFEGCIHDGRRTMDNR
jgi:hypothetical protein